MSERFFLSEQEKQNRYGEPVICISEAWTHSDIYYDVANDQFIEERYHEEYLDTGTVCDGCFIISDGELWRELVRTCNEKGMTTYLKYRKHIPEPFQIGKTVTMDEDEFFEGINAMRQNEPWRCYYWTRIGSIMVITNESNTILGILGKTDYYYFFFDPTSDVKERGFQIWEEALAYAFEKLSFYHNNRVERDKVREKPEIVKPSSTPIETRSKQSIFKKLLGKE